MVKSKRKLRQQKHWLLGGNKVLLALMLFSLLCSIFLFFQFKLQTQLLIAITGFISLLYPFGLREIPYCKIFIITLVWSVSTVLLLVTENNLEINYLVSNAEELSKNITNKFDVITCMELLEHVPNPLSIIKAADKMIKPGGHIIFSTINRNIKAYALAILAGEYILNLIPKGTHQYEKFIKPSELISWCSQYKLKVNDLSAIKYNPILRTCSLRGTPDVNYILDVISDD